MIVHWLYHGSHGKYWENLGEVVPRDQHPPAEPWPCPAGVEHARRVPLASTGAVEAVLSAAAVAAPRALSSARSGWTTPLPQSTAEDAVHLVGAEVGWPAHVCLLRLGLVDFVPLLFSWIDLFVVPCSLLGGG